MPAQTKSVRLSNYDRNYVTWLCEHDPKRFPTRWLAAVYALHGADEHAKARRNGKPDKTHCDACRMAAEHLKASPHAPVARSERERRAAREADMSEEDRRWVRIQQPCWLAGCIYPINHSGPHKLQNMDL